MIEEALERPEANACDYARSNYCENWAVHLGEEILAAEPGRMISMLEYAPLRASLLSRALRDSLKELEHCDKVTSLYSRQFLARTNFIEQCGKPLAIKSIEKSLKDRTLDAERIELLEWLSKENYDSDWLKSHVGKIESSIGDYQHKVKLSI